MVSKDSKNPVEWVREENYVFDLKPFKTDIRKWIESGAIKPENFVSTAWNVLESCETLSISRDSKRLQWGISVPNDPSQTVCFNFALSSASIPRFQIYVWLDALTNYLTAAKYPALSTWPPDVQIIGKDIIKFHAVYWPAFLLAAGLPLPGRLFVHSHWLVDGRKMSKSYGNVLNPHDLAKTLTTEGLRFFLLRQGTPQDDSSNLS